MLHSLDLPELPCSPDGSHGKRPREALHNLEKDAGPDFDKENDAGQVPAGSSAAKKPRVRYPRGGTVQYLTASEHLPAGPRSVQELANWPDMVVSKLLDTRHAGHKDRLLRLRENCEPGLALHTDFSGKGCFETSMRMLLKALAKAGVETHPIDAVSTHSVNDIAPLCLRVQMHPTADRAVHVFKGLRERLPPAQQEELRKLGPSKDASLYEKKVAFERVENYLIKNSAACFGQMATKGCAVGSCLLHPNMACQPWMPPISKATDYPDRPLTINCSGSMCTPFSSFGSRSGMAHDATESWHLHRLGQQFAQMDVSTLENSVHFPEELWVRTMTKTHHVITIRFGPEQLGHPAVRQRMLSTAIRRETLLWTGPGTDAEIWQDFMKFFQCSVGLEGDIYAKLDTAENQREARARYARMKGMDPVDVMDKSLASFLCPSYAKHLRKYHEVMAEREGMGGSFIGDISQNPSHRLRGGAWMPTLARSSQMVSISQGNYVFTPGEIEFSQGWPLPTVDKTYQDCVAYDPSQLSAAQHRSLSGNGQHLLAIAAWHAYVLAHCIRVPLAVR